jgi:hypothetical protein
MCPERFQSLPVELDAVARALGRDREARVDFQRLLDVPVQAEAVGLLQLFASRNLFTASPSFSATISMLTTKLALVNGHSRVEVSRAPDAQQIGPRLSRLLPSA